MTLRGQNQGLWGQGHLEPKAKVLLIEDEPRDRNFYEAVLRDRGYDVVLCGTPTAGINCLEQQRFDLIIVSQGGPDFEGRPVLERAVEIDRRIPVLVITRCLSMNCYLDAMQLGAVDYLEKPVPPERLAWVLETHLRRSSSQA